MKKLIIKNDFHNTESIVALRAGKTTISRSTMKRVARELCRVDGCRCSDSCGALGERGPQDFSYDYTVDDCGNITSVIFFIND